MKKPKPSTTAWIVGAATLFLSQEAAMAKLIPAEAVEPTRACLRAAGEKREKHPNEPSRIAVKHILIKHAFSKKPEGAPRRTREEACLRALEARDKIRGGADFGAIVKDYSEEPGAASREGSLGQIERSDVLAPFADAAFELEVNQVSDVVETEFGFHVILRTE